jgi:hypothetical protein
MKKTKQNETKKTKKTARLDASSNHIGQGESLYRHNCVLCIHFLIVAGYELGAAGNKDNDTSQQPNDSGNTAAHGCCELLSKSKAIANAYAPLESRLEGIAVGKALAQVMALGSAQNSLHSRIEEVAVRAMILVCFQAEQRQPNAAQEEDNNM